jgi:hypothetical protein
MTATPDSTHSELEATMPTRQPSAPAVPGTTSVPWWTGVPGLDPGVRYADWRSAAEFAAMACAAYVLGSSAARVNWWQSWKSAPARKWLTWLLEAAGDADAGKRILALRLVCERAAEIPDDKILGVATSLHAACTPGARLR